MRKLVLVLLTGILLAVSACSYAQYDQYQLTVGDPLNGVHELYPLDAHNVIVTYRPYDAAELWHVSWYRDGELYRDLNGPFGERIDLDLRMPKPAGWDGEHLSMYYCVRKGELKTIQDEYSESPDPDNYITCTARWTENGLEQEHELQDKWFDLYCSGQVALYERENEWIVRYDGKETVLPRSISADTWFYDCQPTGNGAFLLKFCDGETGTPYAAYIDQGQEKYRIGLPKSETAPARLFASDSRGGFLYRDGLNSGDYSPVKLMHFNADGQFDRSAVLVGDRVVIRPFAATAGPDDGLLTLYGTAVANSRKIYSVFALTFDDELNIVRRDIRNIDPEYGDYEPMISLTPDGTVYVYISEIAPGDKPWKGMSPVMIPFGLLKKTDKTYGLRLQ